MEVITYKTFKYTMWDVGGHEKIRDLWPRYYQNTDALMFIVDSADKEGFSDAADEHQVSVHLSLLSGPLKIIFVLLS